MSSRIGILVTRVLDLDNWQLRIIQAILNNPSFEPVLLVHTGRQNHRTRVQSFGGSGLLVYLQLLLERKVFFKPVFCVDATHLQQQMESLPRVGIEPSSDEATNSLAEATLQRIQKEKLDLILDLESPCPNRMKALAKGTRLGVWSLWQGDAPAVGKIPIGFLEVVHKRSNMVSRLVQYTPNGKKVLVDQAFFNRGWAMVETATIAREGSVSMLLRNLEKLGTAPRSNIDFNAGEKVQKLRFSHVVRYMTRFYGVLAAKIEQRMAYTLWGQRHECWSIFVGKGHFMEKSIQGLKPLKMPKDEFWADPFLFTHKDTDYVFFENYSYRTKRGKISCGRLDGEELVDINDVLDLEYHLSFPHIFEERGEIYLMPESSENQRLEIYKASDFPLRWELVTTAFEGERVADAFFFTDDQDQKWLFLNKQKAETAPLNSELFIYRVESLALKALEPHAQNPVLIDARVARNGGGIFAYGNELYRPSQRNTDGIYGRALNINRITKLTLEEYEEETVRIVEPDFDKNLMATHHLHQSEGLFVIDAAYTAK